uniref:Tether containing UBX domain for GLUT4 n=1 Tax=Rhipicephalus zambeziensis TaxID=60191 RepID=A0A224Z5H2_9ACAR
MTVGGAARAMAASLSLVVLYPNGHRQVFHVNSNTSIFQILEDACKKQRLNPSEYDLYHHERPLSHSLPVSFTNLPNNAELELRAAANGQRRTTAAAAASVDICLQLENGERLMAQFPASASLFDVVSHWPDKIEVQDAAQKMDLVCVYMRKEIVGTEQLRATTLQNLGLTSGRAAIRLLHRAKGCVVQQAHVSRHFAVPFKKEEDPPAARDVSPNWVQAAPTSPNRPTSPKQLRAATPVKDMATSPSRPRSASPQDVDMKSPSSGRSPARGNDSADPKVRFSPPPATKKAETLTVREEDIKYIGERKAVLFNLEHCPPLTADEFGDSFYEVTIEDAKYLLADYKRQRDALENRPLETKQLREQRQERLAKNYPVVLIRIYFPDRYVLQGTFLAEERVADVVQFVRGFLRDNTMEFNLYTAPPKQILDLRQTLIEANLVPASVVHFGGAMKPGVPLLRDDILGMVSTPGGATAAATRLREEIETPLVSSSASS